MSHPSAVASWAILSAIILAASTAATGEPKTSPPAKPADGAAGDPLAGIVLDPAGSPVAGCKVWMSIGVPQEDSVAEDVFQETTTDSQGRFAFRGVRPEALSMFGQWVSLFARDAKGRVGWASRFGNAQSVRGAGEFEFRLIEVGTHQGRVEGPSGEPIAKATVRPVAFWRGEPGIWEIRGNIPPAVTRELATETGPEGAFVLRGVPIGVKIDAGVSAAGFASVEAGWSFGRPITIRLAPAGSVRGKLVAAGDPKAIAGVRLRLVEDRALQQMKASAPQQYNYSYYSYSSFYSLKYDPFRSRETAPQAGGTFALTHVAPSRYTLLTSLPANSPYCVESDAAVMVKPREVTTDVVIKLAPAMPVHGTVVDAATDAGVADAYVILAAKTKDPFASSRTKSLISSRRVRTDIHGRYSANVAPGKLEVSIESAPEEFTVPVSIDFVARREEDAAVPPIRLQRNWTAQGTVVDESARPVAGAKIGAYG